MFKLPMGFVKDESGTTAIEYALIASLISVVIVTAVTTIGTTLTGFFQTVAAAFYSNWTCQRINHFTRIPFYPARNSPCRGAGYGYLASLPAVDPCLYSGLIS